MSLLGSLGSLVASGSLLLGGPMGIAIGVGYVSTGLGIAGSGYKIKSWY